MLARMAVPQHCVARADGALLRKSAFIAGHQPFPPNPVHPARRLLEQRTPCFERRRTPSETEVGPDRFGVDCATHRKRHINWSSPAPLVQRSPPILAARPSWPLRPLRGCGATSAAPALELVAWRGAKELARGPAGSGRRTPAATPRMAARPM